MLFLIKTINYLSLIFYLILLYSHIKEINYYKITFCYFISLQTQLSRILFLQILFLCMCVCPVFLIYGGVIVVVRHV